MNQFNQAAAEKIANDIAYFPMTQTLVKAIKRYCEEQSQPLPTPEVIEFDLDKYKTGQWNVEYVRDSNNVIRHKWDAEYEVLIIDYGLQKAIIDKRAFSLLRLIREPVPTKKVWWKRVMVGPYDSQNEAAEAEVFGRTNTSVFTEAICIEEPIKNS